MCTTRLELMEKIQILRKELIQVGVKEGLQSKNTITISQKLDVYISQYQRLVK